MSKRSSKKISWIEGGIIALALGFLTVTMRSVIFDPELEINIVFILLLFTLFFFRSSSIRHMYFAFILLLLSVVGSIFQIERFSYTTASLALSLFILGIINMVLFKREQ